MGDFSNHFRDKKITAMGLGLLGRGVGDVAYLARCGAKLTVTDLKDEETLADSLERLAAFSGIRYVLGEHKEEDFRDCDYVLKAAGVPLDSPYIATARSAGIPIKMSASWFAELSQIPVIGVTGTRGKSTVTHLIHHALQSTTEGEVLLGGNVRGVSTLALLDAVQEESVAVMELDSWQLQGFGEAGISPRIAVFTNFMDDHLNYYGGDRDLYFKDKAQIFLHQKSGDTFVTTPEVFSRAEAFAKQEGVTFAAEVLLTDDSLVPEGWVVPIPGEHNRRNIALAVQALRAAGLTEEEIQAGVETFAGVPGRLEFLGERGGVKIFNDNNATTPEATIAALRAVGDESDKRVVLITGGADKGLALDELAKEIQKYTKHVALLAGSGTEKLAPLVPEAVVHDSLSSAVTDAVEHAEDGDVLLFSPGFASFGMFKNEYDRNDQFVELIRKL